MLTSRFLALALAAFGAGGLLAGEVWAQEGCSVNKAKQKSLAAFAVSGEPEVSVQTRIVTLERDTADHFLALAGFQEITGSKQESGKVAFLTDEQVKNWLGLFEHDLVSKWTITTMEAPTTTVQSGQAIDVREGDESALGAAAKALPEKPKDRLLNLNFVLGSTEESIKTGLSGRVLPVVSADGQFVRLSIDLTRTSVYGTSDSKKTARKLTLEKTAVVPDGRTVVFHLGMAKGQNLYQYPIPLLSEIPYLGDMFSVGACFSGERDVFLLVTPQIVEVVPAKN